MLKTQLEEASRLFYVLSLYEAYHFFRRFFDRIPFCFEEEHADYSAMFCRVLLELGKARELEFYINELEPRYAKGKNPLIGHSLSMFYLHQRGGMKMQKTYSLLTELRSVFPSSSDLGVKNCLSLVCCDYAKREVSRCVDVMDSIPKVLDPKLNVGIVIWKAKILCAKNNFEGSGFLLEELFSNSLVQEDWYLFLSVSVTLLAVYVRTQKIMVAKQVFVELEKYFEHKMFKVIQRQLGRMRQEITQAESGVICSVKTNFFERGSLYQDCL